MTPKPDPIDELIAALEEHNKAQHFGGIETLMAARVRLKKAFRMLLAQFERVVPY